MAGAVGLEPTTDGFGDRYSTNWAIPLKTLNIKIGAGDGNRTHVASLEG